jgi:hypothetical protein
MGDVLCLSRPRDKCLAGTLKTSPAEELGHRERVLCFAGTENERGEYGLRLLQGAQRRRGTVMGAGRPGGLARAVQHFAAGTASPARSGG